MKEKVLGLGAMAMDIILRVNELPKRDSTSFIGSQNLIPGGSCANVLVTLSRLGIDTAIVGKLGTDRYSKLYIKDLINNNIDTSYIIIKDGGTMFCAYVIVDKYGQNCILTDMGNSFLELKEEEVGEKNLEDVSIFYNDMFLGKPSLKLARICKNKGIPVVFNLQCSLEFMKLLDVRKMEIEEMISLSDIFISTVDGFIELSGINRPKEAIKIVYEKYKPKIGAIATYGSKGSIGIIDGDLIFTPSYKVKIMDTTGAGDAFIGGLIYSYFIEHKSARESLDFANVCAAIKCTQVGGRIDTSLEEIIELAQI